MRYCFVLLIMCASCTPKSSSKAASVPSPQPALPVTASGIRAVTPTPKANTLEKAPEKELEKIMHWFEQMDAVLREALWVVKKERPPQSKSIFGKLQRALLVEMKQRLSNKSLFSCDVYSMSRKVLGLSGVPQTAEAFHKCSAREGFQRFADWNHPNANELSVHFQGNALSEVLGIATGIFNPKINCKLKSNDAGLIETFSCENLMLDYNPTKSQVLKFTRFEFVKAGKQILHLRAEVLENLQPVRKIEADVPMDGAILVTETVLKGPVLEPKREALLAPTAVLPIAGLPTAPIAGSEPLDPRQQPPNAIQATDAPLRPGGRGEALPIPASALGVPGAPRPMPGGLPGQMMPTDPDAGGANSGAAPAPGYDPRLPPELQPGEYHEGGPLPGAQPMPSAQPAPGTQQQPGPQSNPYTDPAQGPQPQYPPGVR